MDISAFSDCFFFFFFRKDYQKVLNCWIVMMKVMDSASICNEVKRGE